MPDPSDTTATVSNAPPSANPSATVPVPQSNPVQSDQSITPAPAAQPSPAVQTPPPSSQTAQGQQPSTQPSSTVSNGLPPAAQASIQRAGVLRTIAQTLAGGPRYRETIDPTTGQTTRTEVPLSSKDIGLAIVSEVLAGAMSGFGAKPGPGVEGRATAAGFQQAIQQRQQSDQQQQQQTQQDLKNRTSALAAQAANYEANSRAVLNTAQAERYGVDSLKDAVTANSQLLAGYADQGAVLESHVSQDALQAGIASGQYDSTKQIAIPDGFTNLNGRYEQTFSIVQNPRAKVPLTDAQAQAFGDAGILGWSQYKGGKSHVPDGFMVPGPVIANANQQLQAIDLMKQDVSGVVNALSKSSDKSSRELATAVPNIQAALNDPNNGPALQASLMKLQKYVSHTYLHGLDFYESLQQMAQPSKASPQNPKQFIPNPDASAAQTIAGFFGGGDAQRGWQVLKADHDAITPEPIKSVAEAQSIVTDPASTPHQVARANAYLVSDRQQKEATALAEAKARQEAKPQLNSASISTPDALGFTPTVSTQKEADQRFRGFKKNLDDLSRTEQSYSQFQQALADIKGGNWTGADSVVALFNAIGLSAAPLQGRGFRITGNTISEHEHARGWLGALQAKLQGVSTGAVITPQQLSDYANIAGQARAQQIISTANEMHSAGISADAALPTGNGRRIDADTAKIFLTLAGNDPKKARAAATAKGWVF